MQMQNTIIVESAGQNEAVQEQDYLFKLQNNTKYNDGDHEMEVALRRRKTKRKRKE